MWTLLLPLLINNKHGSSLRCFQKWFILDKKKRHENCEIFWRLASRGGFVSWKAVNIFAWRTIGDSVRLLRRILIIPFLQWTFFSRQWIQAGFKAALLEGAAVDPSHLNYSGSPAGEGQLVAFSGLLLMAYSVVSDTTGSNRVYRHDSELFNSPPLRCRVFGSGSD